MDAGARCDLNDRLIPKNVKTKFEDFSRPHPIGCYAGDCRNEAKAFTAKPRDAVLHPIGISLGGFGGDAQLQEAVYGQPVARPRTSGVRLSGGAEDGGRPSGSLCGDGRARPTKA